jgi:hypothetical protein
MSTLHNRTLAVVVMGLAACKGAAADTARTNVEVGIPGCGDGCAAEACQEWFADLDGDGYGVGPAQKGCGDPPAGFARTPGDCCDVGGVSRAVAAMINPGQDGRFSAPQTVCPKINEFDYDCSGTITDQIGVSVGAAQAGNCGPNCDGSGWVLDVGCGDSGSLVQCSRYQGNCSIDSRSPSQKVVRECN